MKQRSEADTLPPAGAPDVATVREWLRAHVANLLEIEKSEVRTNLPLGRYGLDSAAALTLTGDLGEWLGCALDPTLLYEHKTIDAVAEYLVANHAKLRVSEMR